MKRNTLVRPSSGCPRTRARSQATPNPPARTKLAVMFRAGRGLCWDQESPILCQPSKMKWLLCSYSHIFRKTSKMKRNPLARPFGCPRTRARSQPTPTSSVRTKLAVMFRAWGGQCQDQSHQHCTSPSPMKRYRGWAQGQSHKECLTIRLR